MSDRRITPAFTLPLAALAMAGCDSGGTVVAGPRDISSSPQEIAFLGPVPVSGPRRELCFDFQPPGESLKAPSLLAVLVTTEGRRDSLQERQLDRRGEGTVCLIAALPDSLEIEQLRGTHYRGVELRSSAPPVHLKAIRWWSGR